MSTKSKKTRKHQGIIQSGGNKGKLKKGYKYSGKKLKSGLPQILKVTKKKNKSQKKNKILRGGYSESHVEYNDNLTEFLNNNVPPPRIGRWKFSKNINYRKNGGPQTIVYHEHPNPNYQGIKITRIDKKSQRTGNILPYKKLHNKYKVKYNEKFNNNTIWDIHATQVGISNIDGEEYIYHVYGVNGFDSGHTKGTFVYTAQDYGGLSKWEEINSANYSNMVNALENFIQSLKKFIQSKEKLERKIKLREMEQEK